MTLDEFAKLTPEQRTHKRDDLMLQYQNRLSLITRTLGKMAEANDEIGIIMFSEVLTPALSLAMEKVGLIVPLPTEGETLQ